MPADVFDCQNPSENVRGYYLPIANLLGHVSVTKIRVHSLIDAENPGEPPSTEQKSTETCRWVPLTVSCIKAAEEVVFLSLWTAVPEIVADFEL